MAIKVSLRQKKITFTHQYQIQKQTNSLKR